MKRHIQPLALLAGALGIAGGVIVLLGTYWIAWFSLLGQTLSGVHRYGGISLYRLQMLSTGGWYSYASQVMALGAVLLVGSGVAAMISPQLRSLRRGVAACLVAGSLFVLAVAFATGLPHWFSHEPLYFARGNGEWVCITGAILGLVGAATATRIERGIGNRLEGSVSKSTVPVG
jgi:hypothetical protein